MKSIIIAGTNSGVGKTTITIGLIALLKKKGLKVQPFKVGPDFIDTGYHTLIAGRPSRNLDGWMMSEDYVKGSFYKNSSGADFAVIEGVMGLFDGLDGKGLEGSTAQIAKILNIPVILIVDAKAMAGSAGAVAYGFENYDKDVRIAGVIFNNVGSQNHYRILKGSVEHRCKATVLGYLQKDSNIAIPSRHLGLVTVEDNLLSEKIIDKLSDIMETNINLDKILDMSLVNSNLSIFNIYIKKKEEKRITLAVAYDKAFNFYYQDNLDILTEYGAELKFFSPLNDKNLPDNIDSIYIGGGYPEIYAKELEANASLRVQIKKLAEDGMFIYAECGGLMYLTEGITDLDGRMHEMVGIFPAAARMLSKRKSLGYVCVEAIDDAILTQKGSKIRGHEFHYSEIDMPDTIKRAYKVTKASSGDERLEGYCYKNVLASHVHIHFGSNIEWAKNLINMEETWQHR
jgi:cobyrinic acid a,c-diamide synthase